MGHWLQAGRSNPINKSSVASLFHDAFLTKTNQSLVCKQVSVAQAVARDVGIAGWVVWRLSLWFRWSPQEGAYGAPQGKCAAPRTLFLLPMSPGGLSA